MKANILIVEDEEALTLLLRYNLEAEGYGVETVPRGDEADLLLKARRREHSDLPSRAIPREVEGVAALRQIGRDVPLVGIDALDMARSAKRLEASHVGSDIRRRIAA